MIKSITTFILCTAIIFCLGYIAIEWNHSKFEQLCKDEPTIPQCPKPERMKTL